MDRQTGLSSDGSVSPFLKIDFRGIQFISKLARTKELKKLFSFRAKFFFNLVQKSRERNRKTLKNYFCESKISLLPSLLKANFTAFHIENGQQCIRGWIVIKDIDTKDVRMGMNGKPSATSLALNHQDKAYVIMGTTGAREPAHVTSSFAIASRIERKAIFHSVWSL